ncbi:MAG: hypothetical protein KDD64_00085 [Bdellovibrionales bacterium]|nr:hypothetical protein [Bdellovibrionales bacterium]
MTENPPWEKLHDQACMCGEESYIDPETGYSVFTSVFHLSRGYCCGSGCRHCPYDEKSESPYEASHQTTKTKRRKE